MNGDGSQSFNDSIPGKVTLTHVGRYQCKRGFIHIQIILNECSGAPVPMLIAGLDELNFSLFE